jgi:hypothetical protein
VQVIVVDDPNHQQNQEDSEKHKVSYSCKSVLGMPQLARDDDCGVLLLLPLWPAATPPGEGRGVDTESVGECAKDGEEKNCGRSFSLAHRPPGGWCAVARRVKT